LLKETDFITDWSSKLFTDVRFGVFCRVPVFFYKNRSDTITWKDALDDRFLGARGCAWEKINYETRIEDFFNDKCKLVLVFMCRSV